MYTTTPNGWSPTNTCTNCPGFDSSDCCGGTATWQNNWNNGFTGCNGWNGFGGFNGPIAFNTPRFGTNFPWANNAFANATPWNSTPWSFAGWNNTPSTNWNNGWNNTPNTNWNNGWNNTPNTNWNNGWNNTPSTNWNNGWNNNSTSTVQAFETNLRDAFRTGYEAGLAAGYRAAFTNLASQQTNCTPGTTSVSTGTRPSTNSCTPTQSTRGYAPTNAPTGFGSNTSSPNNSFQNSSFTGGPTQNPSQHGPFQGNGFWNAACGTAPQATHCSTASPNLSGDEFAHGVKCCDDRGDCNTPAYAGMKVRSVA
jgi:hypothetical protein